MATLALPISELAPAVSAAQAETKCVLSYSKSAVANFGVAWHILSKTISLRHRLSRLATKQGKFIADLISKDFSASADEQLEDLASSLDSLVSSERALLKEANQLGSEIRVWWNTSLLTLEEQIEHMDSVAESLHVECDNEASALLAFAAEHFAMNEAAQFAMK